MRSLTMLALVLPAVLAMPLEVTTHHQYSPSSCVIADVAFPDPRHALVLLGRRELSPPTGLSERTFTDLLVWCHEFGRSSSGLLVARQEGGCSSEAFGGPVGSDSTAGTINPGGTPQNSSASGDQSAGSSAAGPSTTPPSVTPVVSPANSVVRPASPGGTPSETPGDATGPTTSGTSIDNPASPGGTPSETPGDATGPTTSGTSIGNLASPGGAPSETPGDATVPTSSGTSVSGPASSDASSDNIGTPTNPAGSTSSGNAAATTGPADSNTPDNGNVSATPQSALPESATPSTVTSPVLVVDGTSSVADVSASDSLNNAQANGIAAAFIPSGVTPQTAPDGTVNGGTTPQIVPDGTINGGTTPQSVPDGTVNGGTTPQTAPDGIVNNGTPAPTSPTASTPATPADSPIAGTGTSGCPSNILDVTGVVSVSVGSAATCDSV